MSSLMHFLSSGKYIRLHTTEKYLEILKERIRHYQETLGHQRVEWPEQGVVGKFAHFRKYDYDEAGLKEFMDERGLLPVISTVKWKDLSVDEHKSLGENGSTIREVLLKFIPNAEVRMKKEEIECYKRKISDLVIDDLVWQWKETKAEYKSLSKKWEWIRYNSPAALSNPERYNKYGIVISIKPDPIIDAVHAFKCLGRNTFMKLCKVQDDLVVQYGLKGYYSLKETRKFRHLTGIQTRYYLMKLHEETRVREMLQNRMREYSIVSQFETN
ncbi:hypothetical protein A8990_1432 [Paenibacillus taihuensis]|uniref:Uncharacterized protein n=1 Tax=Paenibacillus taihuensis TaxID=1156355 RepID=A0A3D9QUE5_9BACL|nr:hypothetical protein [Paenibacillus taihuensis]REE67297.1 hypothetical protein A8990_1432 [Paenibacillus taihuensis]